MPITITIQDRTTSGEQTSELTLEFLTERVTVRELIRSRVYQEVTEFNAKKASETAQPYNGPVEPTAAERALNGEGKPAKRRDWQDEYEKALTAFERNGFLLLAGKRQLIDLDEEIELRHDTEVVFLKLVPLVGG
jgi:hypothetical protein